MISRKLLKNSEIHDNSNIEQCYLSVLPEITPILTILLIIIFSTFLWRKVVFTYKNVSFIEFCALQSLIFFIFGFHVHEKAILIPLSLYQLAIIFNKNLKNDVFLLSFVSGITLFPMLSHPAGF